MARQTPGSGPSQSLKRAALPSSLPCRASTVTSPRHLRPTCCLGASAAADSALPPGAYDAVFAFECLHDMPRPVEVLAAAARALAPEGCVVVMDEAVAESFTAPGDELERLMYGFSLLVCLPDGMAHPPTVATGTVMRPNTLRSYGQAAGLETFEILPIEGFGFWRFYRLAR